MGRKENDVMYLEVELTPDELRECSNLMADAWRKKNQAEEKLASTSKMIKSEISEAEARISKYAEMVNARKEYRDVEVRIEWNFDAKTKTFIRVDTNAIVKTVAISDSELQEELEIQKKEPVCESTPNPDDAGPAEDASQG